MASDLSVASDRHGADPAPGDRLCQPPGSTMDRRNLQWCWRRRCRDVCLWNCRGRGRGAWIRSPTFLFIQRIARLRA